MMIVDILDVFRIYQWCLFYVDGLFNELPIIKIQNSVGITFNVWIVGYLKMM